MEHDDYGPFLSAIQALLAFEVCCIATNSNQLNCVILLLKKNEHPKTGDYPSSLKTDLAETICLALRSVLRLWSAAFWGSL